MDKELRAKVFISCGQRKGSDEVQVADKIKIRLTNKGYDPYVAVQETTLKGLKENIFYHLSTAEYFLFIDFKREQLVNSDSTHRGSLFCHQELAIASYLDLPILGFQEIGLRKNDGILQALQANFTEFSDRHTLHDVITSQIDEQGWKPNWKNQLVMERDKGQYEDALINVNGQPKPARFFHISVKNLNPHKHAKNCYAFLESITNEDTGEVTSLRSVEFKWAGYGLPNTTILPGKERPLDAFYVLHEAPNTLHFNLFTDSGHFVPRVQGTGNLKLTYAIISDNFNPIRTNFRLCLGDTLESISFEEDI
jgi:hypothetical protein